MKDVAFTPRIDVVDTGHAFEVTVERPGVDVRDMKATLRQGALTMAQREREKAPYVSNADALTAEFRLV